MEFGGVQFFSLLFVKKFEKWKRKTCQPSLHLFPLCLLSAPEEEGARGAAGGCDPGLREDSHGEEQPPEGSGQDGQRCTLQSLWLVKPSVHYRNIGLNMADDITGQLILEMTTADVDVPVRVWNLSSVLKFGLNFNNFICHNAMWLIKL